MLHYIEIYLWDWCDCSSVNVIVYLDSDHFCSSNKFHGNPSSKTTTSWSCLMKRQGITKGSMIHHVGTRVGQYVSIFQPATFGPQLVIVSVFAYFIALLSRSKTRLIKTWQKNIIKATRTIYVTFLLFEQTPTLVWSKHVRCENILGLQAVFLPLILGVYCATELVCPCEAAFFGDRPLNFEK